MLFRSAMDEKDKIITEETELCAEALDELTNGKGDDEDADLQQ